MRRLVRDLAIAVVVGLVVAGAVFGVQWSRPPVYRSTAAMMIDQPRLIAVAPNDGVLLKLSRLRQKYVGLARTSTVHGPVAARAGVGQGVVRAGLFATADIDSLLIFLSASADDPDAARRIAQETAVELQRIADDDQAQAGVAVENRYVLTIPGPAPPGGRVAPDFTRAAGSGLLAGAAAAGLLLAGLRLRRGPAAAG